MEEKGREWRAARRDSLNPIQFDWWDASENRATEGRKEVGRKEGRKEGRTELDRFVIGSWVTRVT